MNGNNKTLNLCRYLAIIALLALTSLPTSAQVFNEGRDGFTHEEIEDEPHYHASDARWQFMGTGFACTVRVLIHDVIEVATTSEPNCQGSDITYLNICFEPSGPGRLGLPCLDPEHPLIGRGGLSPNWMRSQWINILNRSLVGELKLTLFEASNKKPNINAYPYASKAYWSAPDYVD